MQRLLKREWFVIGVLYMFLAISTLSLSSCGGGGGGGGNNGGGNNTGTTEASGTVGAGGGIVEVTSSTSTIVGTKVSIPVSALSTNTNITIGIVSNAPTFLQDTPSNTIVDFGPDGTQFATPVTVTIPYNASLVSNEDNLGVYYYDTSNAAWDEVQTDTIDKTNNLITAKTNHFTLYGVHEKKAAFDATIYKIDQTSKTGQLAAWIVSNNPLSKWYYVTAGISTGTVETDLQQRPVGIPLQFRHPFRCNSGTCSV